MSMQLTARLGVLAAALSLAGVVHAGRIVSPTSTFALTTELITFDGYDGLTYGLPQSGGPNLYLDNDGDVLFTSTVGQATVGANEQALGGNGQWGARVFGPTPTGEGNFLSAFAPVLFNFGADGPQAQVGAFFNLTQPETGNKTNALTLTAYGENLETLESFTYVVNTPIESYNEGLFLGFARTRADIYNFGISIAAGESLVMDNLSLSVTPIPEAEGYAMMLLGLAGLGLLARRRA